MGDDLHWGTFHNCRIDEDGERVADVRALCGAADATAYVFRPEQITCERCRRHRERLIDELSQKVMPLALPDAGELP